MDQMDLKTFTEHYANNTDYMFLEAFQEISFK